MERSPVPDLSPTSPPPPLSAPAPADTRGPSYTAQHSPEHVHVQFEGACGCYGCCLFTCYYTSIAGPEVGPSRGDYRAQPCHASTYHEPPRSPA